MDLCLVFLLLVAMIAIAEIVLYGLVFMVITFVLMEEFGLAVVFIPARELFSLVAQAQWDLHKWLLRGTSMEIEDVS